MAALRRALLITAKQTLNSLRTNSLPTSIQSQSLYRISQNQLIPVCNFSSYKSQSFDIDLSNEEKKRQIVNRLLYRSKQRGYLELDLVLGNWVQENVSAMDESRIKALVDVLDLENPELWKWLTGQEQPPENITSNPVFCAVRDKVMSNLNTHASPETRATPGKAWVRGWDDCKKGPDSPVYGNQ